MTRSQAVRDRWISKNDPKTDQFRTRISRSSKAVPGVPETRVHQNPNSSCTLFGCLDCSNSEQSKQANQSNSTNTEQLEKVKSGEHRTPEFLKSVEQSEQPEQYRTVRWWTLLKTVRYESISIR